jgi:pre-mRNA-splicing factor SPF27
MASAPAVFDSLPYYDNDLEQFPILREKVDRELAKEGPPPAALHPSLSPELEIFGVSTPLCVLVT